MAEADHVESGVKREEGDNGAEQTGQDTMEAEAEIEDKGGVETSGHALADVKSAGTNGVEDAPAPESRLQHVEPQPVQTPSAIPTTATLPGLEDVDLASTVPVPAIAPSILLEDDEPGSPSSAYSSRPHSKSDNTNNFTPRTTSPMPGSPTFSEPPTPFEDAVSAQPDHDVSAWESREKQLNGFPFERTALDKSESSSSEHAQPPTPFDTFESAGTVHERTNSPSVQSSTDTETTIERSSSPSPEYTPSPPETPIAPVSPLTHTEASVRTSTYRDSMASIALSESSLDYDHLSPEAVEQALATPRVRASRHMRKPSSLEILQNMWAGDARPQLERQNTLFDAMKDEPSPTPIETEGNVWGDMKPKSQLKAPEAGKWHKRTTSLNAPRWTPDSPSSDDQVELDWQQLDKEEEWEKEDRDLPAGAEDESTAFLLARLEQENAKITSFSSSVASMISDRNAPSIRYSLALSPDTDFPAAATTIPDPPPMTELEFWAALVQDYPSTAVRLPTLTTTKIRAGIPPPLRGVVWQSMAGARDTSLEEAFDRLQHEQSPYEGIINKDVGRSFPGVELFRDAEGEGQKMLGRVLKCFSLHDTDIGYCQGLGFLVGPLLMNMGEREAFCVLVRLMEHYSLRPSFLPSLSGLHMRIFQFSSLIRRHQPELSRHLGELGIEPAYLSQWFLSCFSVTCPLPMLFRIYDVIFAEGANETVMRVALALMRRNEARMMGCGEFEEVMQLLLGRGIWDCYGLDADALVDDFTSLGGVITHARLAELEREFEAQKGEAVGGHAAAGFLPDVQAAASRFLGRLWAPSHGVNKGSVGTLSPAAAEGAAAAGKMGAAGSGRRRSKMSVSTLNDASGSENGSSGTSSSASGAASLASTSVTEPEGGVSDSAAVMRESQSQATNEDGMSFKSGGGKAGSVRTMSLVPSVPGGHPQGGLSREEREMHGQIEDLLTALSELQREHQELAALLQRESEERGEDQVVVRRLVKRLQRKEEGGEAKRAVGEKEMRRKTLPPPPRDTGGEGEGGRQRPRSVVLAPRKAQQEEDVGSLVENVAQRLETNNRFSHSFETKAELRSKLTRIRERLAAAEASSSDLAARLEIAETSLAAFTSESEDLRAEVKELRVRVNEEFKTRQKLEHAIRELKAEARVVERKERERLAKAEGMQDGPTAGVRRGSASLEDGGGPGKRGSVIGAPGLRELRLTRRDSSSSVQSLRVMRGQRPAPPPEICVQTQQLPPQSQLPLAFTTESPTASAGEASGGGGSLVSPPFSAAATGEPQTPVLSSATTTAPASSVTSASTSASALAVPAPSAMWHARTSSLATKEVLATPEHEVVPDEALLLELVNAKTAEAQSRAEVDELRRALKVGKRRYEEMVVAMRAEVGRAEEAGRVAGREVEAARSHAGVEGEGGLGVLATAVGVGEDGESRSVRSLGGETGSPGSTTPGWGEKSLPEVPTGKEKEKSGSTGGSGGGGSGSGSSGGGGGGGWFWNRRSPSATARIAVTPPPTE
ncbi:hypothetical protein B0A55_07083 [Friedmanniomyces simplex]|uniref:Rab-GAP TBC domain-containing protein n=1 Tax=Friedmanniomyces simplex TaxID=329884 RepID=A0A4U0XD58_9PEZI|nr:hypothetical protein B0A55_07083 [Friedmanniomyces simplex]